MKELIEHVHYYFTQDGLLVLTAAYHQERGYCCGNGCRHCPFKYAAVPEPRRSELLRSKKGDSKT